ncbi:MAG TPA: universal stress protein [Nocardioidaceae bacterium]
MTMVVGYAPDERGRTALHLTSLLTRSTDDEIVVCSVVPSPWLPGMARVDAEYRATLEKEADAALEHAKAAMPSDVNATYVRHSARSAPAGLLEVARNREARLIILGSSSAGVFGHVVLGSTTERLLHGSPVAVALAPRGFRCGPDTTITRVTAAYDDSENANTLVVAASTLAAEVGAGLRIASFAVWSQPAYTTRLGTDSEDDVLQSWTSSIEQAAALALGRVADLASAPPKLETVIGRGPDWGAAIDEVEWHDGDVLIVGSSSIGPLAQVFLGTRASKIVRYAPVPVMVLPRRRAELLASEANVRA